MLDFTEYVSYTDIKVPNIGNNNNKHHYVCLPFQAGVAEQQLAELLKEHNAKRGQTEQSGSSVMKLLRALSKPNGYKPLILLASIFTFQQFTGIYITIFYAVNFFKVSFVSETDIFLFVIFSFKVTTKNVLDVKIFTFCKKYLVLK